MKGGRDIARTSMIIPAFNLNKISLSNESTMSKYVRIDKINDPPLLPRVLIAESIITDRFLSMQIIKG